MKIYNLLLTTLIIILPLTAFSYEEERAANNLAHELAICSAYFTIQSQTPLTKKETTGLSARFLQQANIFLTGSAMMSNQKVADTRFAMAFEDMKKELDGTWGNLSILQHQYLNTCSAIAKDPNSRIEYWLNKTD